MTLSARAGLHHPPLGRRSYSAACGALLLAVNLCAFAQAVPASPQGPSTPSPAPAAPAASVAPKQETASRPSTGSESEVNTRENSVTFQSRVNLVTVQVVVRDPRGNVITDLKKEDFRLFDKGKPQVISRFAIQRPGALVAAAAAQPADKNPLEAEEQKSQPAKDLAPVPTRFVAFLFDDLHMPLKDLTLVRAAALKHIDKSLHKTDRAAIYTTSGQDQLDFTDDLDQLHETLNKIRPRSMSGPTNVLCPRLDLYWADLIINKNDQQALQAAVVETMACMNLDPTMPGSQQTAASQAQMTAQQIIGLGDQEGRLALMAVKNTIRRLATLPGERTVVMVSSGFLILDEHRQELMDVVDLATRSKVIVNTLDARGLYTDPTFDASQVGLASPIAQAMTSAYALTSASLEGDVLAEIADGTAGAWFHNNNDLAGGFDKIATTPEVIYVLGFSPENLKYDGSFHKLKVSLVNDHGVTLQARRGYYAPRQMTDASEQAKQEIREAVFSRDPLSDMPLGIRSQFYKTGDMQAKLTIATRIDVRRLPFKRENNRNVDTLTVVTVLFDRNGNYVQGVEKTIDMKLRDVTLSNRLNNGISVRADFDVTRGAYLIRSVVRDAAGQLMAAENGSVEIP